MEILRRMERGIVTIKEFKEYSHNKLIYLDGATGSNQMKRVMPAGVCPEKWILEHPDVLVELQREYVEAGSNILYAPTFTANRIKLAEYGLEGEIARINHALVELSRRAALGKHHDGTPARPHGDYGL